MRLRIAGWTSSGVAGGSLSKPKIIRATPLLFSTADRKTARRQRRLGSSFKGPYARRAKSTKCGAAKTRVLGLLDRHHEPDLDVVDLTIMCSSAPAWPAHLNLVASHISKIYLKDGPRSHA